LRNSTDVKSIQPYAKNVGRSLKNDSEIPRALIAFPIPTIGIKKSLGAMLIAAGLLQERMKHLHVADVYSTFQDVNRELQKLRQKSV
jgi:hypothetical protein